MLGVHAELAIEEFEDERALFASTVIRLMRKLGFLRSMAT